MKKAEKESRVVLVGTYRPANEAWIRDRRLYNLPLPKILSRKERKGAKLEMRRFLVLPQLTGILRFMRRFRVLCFLRKRERHYEHFNK